MQHTSKSTHREQGRKSYNYKKIIIFLGVGITVFAVVVFFNRGRIRESYLDYKFKRIHESLPEEKSAQDVHYSSEKATTTVASLATSSPKTSSSTKLVLPATKSVSTTPAQTTSSTSTLIEMNLKVPFTTQAPFRDWGMPYQEACEETAALMVHYFYEGKTFTKEIADEEIKGLVAFQEQILGAYKDTTAEETARFIREYWGYPSVRVTPATIERIKAEIGNGRPVIIPTSGKQLFAGNPYFRNNGPLYHMLVIKGYTKDGKFITNDPGIGRGESYVYDENLLFNAIHDWNGGKVTSGEKLMIIIDPKK